MEPEVQGHQLADVSYIVVGVLQRPQAVAGHTCTDDIVMVKADPVRTDRTSLWFRNVVEQRGEAQHPVRTGVRHNRKRVGKNVLMPMNRILLERHRRQLRQKVGR